MFPKRGAIALVTTALALVPLFQFKTPADIAQAALDQAGITTTATNG
ncbi:MAG: hypothetical protein ABI562_00265 [Chloroflexota bacterium]